MGLGDCAGTEGGMYPLLPHGYFIFGTDVTLEGSLCAGVSLSPSNPERVEDKKMISFRLPVFVTQSPTQHFPVSSRNALPVLGEDVNTVEASLGVASSHRHSRETLL